MAAAQQPTANWIGNTLRLMLTDDRFALTLSGGRRSVGQALNEVLWEDTPTQNFIGRWAVQRHPAGRAAHPGTATCSSSAWPRPTPIPGLPGGRSPARRQQRARVLQPRRAPLPLPGAGTGRGDRQHGGGGAARPAAGRLAAGLRASWGGVRRCGCAAWTPCRSRSPRPTWVAHTVAAAGPPSPARDAVQARRRVEVHPHRCRTAGEHPLLGRVGPRRPAAARHRVEQLADADLHLGLGQQRPDAEVPAQREGQVVGRRREGVGGVEVVTEDVEAVRFCVPPFVAVGGADQAGDGGALAGSPRR